MLFKFIVFTLATFATSNAYSDNLPGPLPQHMEAMFTCHWGNSTNGGDLVVYRDSDQRIRHQVLVDQHVVESPDFISSHRGWFEGPLSTVSVGNVITGIQGTQLVIGKGSQPSRLTLTDLRITALPVQCKPLTVSE